MFQAVLSVQRLERCKMENFKKEHKRNPEDTEFRASRARLVLAELTLRDAALKGVQGGLSPEATRVLISWAQRVFSPWVNGTGRERPSRRESVSPEIEGVGTTGYVSILKVLAWLKIETHSLGPRNLKCFQYGHVLAHTELSQHPCFIYSILTATLSLILASV